MMFIRTLCVTRMLDYEHTALCSVWRTLSRDHEKMGEVGSVTSIEWSCNHETERHIPLLTSIVLRHACVRLWQQDVRFSFCPSLRLSHAISMGNDDEKKKAESWKSWSFLSRSISTVSLSCFFQQEPSPNSHCAEIPYALLFLFLFDFLFQLLVDVLLSVVGRFLLFFSALWFLLALFIYLFSTHSVISSFSPSFLYFLFFLPLFLFRLIRFSFFSSLDSSIFE